ncbi:DMT family transporter [Corynebacterium guangdongense]|uniref:Transporter family-2 protein n=1 Tax=Corynebacterium guangdongense TaxID=1783348 RepID=A0ABU1ZYW8_9CORY|nr:DMT family transporter [Corynebacterium guangdongense]MDR7330120.1 transporter family-2 protein [Corynebacterium guangdongense]WJZ18678.1 hypothetical protein CGUA_10630 [Corynebacterium guangdongense]
MFVFLAVFAGFLLPVQTSVNSRLRATVGTPLAASTISFAVGTASLASLALAVDGTLRPDVGGLPWWMFLGGAFGVVVLTANIILLPRLGALATAILPIVGQVTMGLLIDAFGWFRSPVVELSVIRVTGAVLVLAGALAAAGVLDRVRSGDLGEADAGASLWFWRLFAVACGMLASSQTAVNGQLGVNVGSPVLAAFISFSVGLTTLIALLLITRTPIRWNAEVGGTWWMWVGGVLGATLVFLNAALAPILGTGLTVMGVLVGMMAASLMIDSLGLMGTRRRQASAPQMGGVLVMLAGVAMIRLL